MRKRGRNFKRRIDPPATYDAMKAAKSVGKFIGASIKGTHKFTKIEKAA